MTYASFMAKIYKFYAKWHKKSNQRAPSKVRSHFVQTTIFLAQNYDNAVNFEMADKLEKFIEKKMNRFERHLNADDKVEIRMSVIKPQTNNNKEVKMRIAGLFAEKTADSFEEGIDACINALEGQLEKRKNN